VGDDAAELYERHSQRVFGYCLSKLGGREDAEDATQLTFLHAVRGLRRGVVPIAESAWLLSIARNVCLARWASASRRSRVESVCDPAELERLTFAPDQRRDELIGLERALELLPEQQRRAVLLRDWRGLSYEEVSAQLGVSHAAVETLIFRGRAALADRLSEQAGESRRRLRSLAGLGSFVNSVKGAVTGAAAGAKLAAGVTAVVAVSGGGLALGTTALRSPTAKPAQAEKQLTPSAPVAGAAVAPVTGGPAETAASAPATAADAATEVTPGLAPADEPYAPDVPDVPDVTTAPVSEPGAEREPDTAAASPVPPVAAPHAERPSTAAAPVAQPVDAPLLEVPSLPPVELPATDTIVAATGPVTAVVNETLASAPELPDVPQLPPLPLLPPVPPVPAPPAIAPLLP
jgi:RNA polymerase sigma-70 factor (ECF subfamily)